MLNRHCDLDLEYNNQFFTQDTTAYDKVPSNHMWMQRLSSSEDNVET